MINLILRVILLHTLAVGSLFAADRIITLPSGSSMFVPNVSNLALVCADTIDVQSGATLKANKKASFCNPPTGDGSINYLPEFTSVQNNVTIKIADEFSYALSSSDDDNTPLTYSVQSGLSSWLELNTTNSLSGTPTTADIGVHDVNLTVTDGIDIGVQNFQITVVNTPPTITSTTTINADENSHTVTTITASDYDNHSLSYSISGGADAASFDIDSTTGVLTFVNTANFESGKISYEVTITVSDGYSGTDSQTLTINITDVNDAPVLNIVPTQTKSKNFADFNITLSAQDEDGNALSYGATSSDTSKATVSVTGDQLTISAVNNAYGSVRIDINTTESSTNPALSDTGSFLLNIEETISTQSGNDIGLNINNPDTIITTDGDGTMHATLGEEYQSVVVIYPDGNTNSTVTTENTNSSVSIDDMNKDITLNTDGSILTEVVGTDLNTSITQAIDGSVDINTTSTDPISTKDIHINLPNTNVSMEDNVTTTTTGKATNAQGDAVDINLIIGETGDTNTTSMINNKTKTLLVSEDANSTTDIDENGTITTEIKAVDVNTTVTQMSNGELNTILDFNGKTTTLEAPANTNTTTSVNANGTISTNIENSNSDISVVQSSDGAVDTTLTNADGVTTKVNVPTGKDVDVTTDENGEMLIVVTNGDGSKVETTVNADGTVETIKKDTGGTVTSNTTSPAGAIITVGANDAPEFNTTAYDIAENDNTTAITIDATDDHDDGATITYDYNATLKDGAYFDFNISTHKLKFTDGRDFENPQDSDTDNIYEVVVYISDTVGTKREGVLSITITDVNNISDDEDGNGISDNDENSPVVDSDGDGIPNHLDTDDDGDGISDTDEGSGDTDNDGTPDYKDTDSDNDGILDITEGNIDTDNDGTPDYKDTDADGDGTLDIDEGQSGYKDNTTTGTKDTDGDGIPDVTDTDDDGDGISDVDEGANNTPLTDTDNDGIPDYKDTDSDNDGILDITEGNIDTDNDGTPDYKDTDADGDGTLDIDEGQSGYKDNTTTGTKDTDGDGITDANDLDDDGDGILDTDEGSGDTDGDGIPDYKDTDSDNDGILDITEGNIDTDNDGTPDYKDTDADGDGTLDIDEGQSGYKDNTTTGTKDTDGDGIPDVTDTDDDGDGILDTNEGSGDTDGDGIPDYKDTDSDNDGILDVDEGSGDTDGDGIPDYKDTDSDNDGILDITEGNTDTDSDGTPDYKDTDADGDGFTPMNGDCNDKNSAVHPGATDLPNNGLDEDCSGSQYIIHIPPAPAPTPDSDPEVPVVDPTPTPDLDPTDPKVPVVDPAPTEPGVIVVTVPVTEDQTDTKVSDIDTGVTIETPQSSNDEKTTIISMSDSNGENTKETKITIPEGATKAITQTGTGVTVDLESSTTKSESTVNNNGTIDTKVTNKDSQEEFDMKSSALGTDILVNSNGAIELSVNNSGVIGQDVKLEDVNKNEQISNSQTTLTSDGSIVEAKVVIKTVDPLTGEETTTTKTINTPVTPNTKVAITDSGSVQLKEKSIGSAQIIDPVTNELSEATVNSLIEIQPNGTTVHIIELVTSSGTKIQTSAISNLVGSVTKSTADGVQTSAVIITHTIENGQSKETYVAINVTADKNGNAEHIMKFRDARDGETEEDVTTKARFNIVGAKTTIKDTGELETSVNDKVDGFAVKAVVKTDVYGNSITRFEKYDSNGNLVEIQKTTQSDTLFEPGNKIIVENRDGKTVIDTTAKVSGLIEF